MKPAPLLLIFVLAMKGLSAQDARVEKLAPPRDRAEPFLKIDTGNKKIRKVPFRNFNGVYSHRGSQGAVYLLRPDQMPCLVPDSNLNARMPNAKHLLVPVRPGLRSKD